MPEFDVNRERDEGETGGTSIDLVWTTKTQFVVLARHKIISFVIYAFECGSPRIYRPDDHFGQPNGE